MNGTRTRIGVALACTAALVALPGSALAAGKKHRAHKTATTVTQSITLHHTFDAGGDGAGALAPTPGVRVNLFDPLAVAVGLGNAALGQLGLPPVTLPTLPTV
jgi:hypothetical protein